MTSALQYLFYQHPEVIGYESNFIIDRPKIKLSIKFFTAGNKRSKLLLEHKFEAKKHENKIIGYSQNIIHNDGLKQLANVKCDVPYTKNIKYHEYDIIDTEYLFDLQCSYHMDDRFQKIIIHINLKAHDNSHMFRISDDYGSVCQKFIESQYKAPIEYNIDKILEMKIQQSDVIECLVKKYKVELLSDVLDFLKSKDEEFGTSIAKELSEKLNII